MCLSCHGDRHPPETLTLSCGRRGETGGKGPKGERQGRRGRGHPRAPAGGKAVGRSRRAGSTRSVSWTLPSPFPGGPRSCLSALCPPCHFTHHHPKLRLRFCPLRTLRGHHWCQIRCWSRPRPLVNPNHFPKLFSLSLCRCPNAPCASPRPGMAFAPSSLSNLPLSESRSTHLPHAASSPSCLRTLTVPAACSPCLMPCAV